MFDAVYAQVETPRASARWLWLFVPAAAVLALFVLPLGDEFRERGERRVPTLDVACEEPCSEGSRVVLAFSQVDEPSFVAAYSEHADGKRTWYFPSDEDFAAAEALPELRAQQARQLLARALLLAAGDGRGARLHVLVLRERKSPAEIAASPDAAWVLARYEKDL